MATRFLRPSPMATAALIACAMGAHAADTITITGRSEPSPGLIGFGNQPVSRTPLQAIAFGSQKLADNDVKRVGELTKLDPSVSDSYNADGYWSRVSLRGYTLDNRFNYRRDGLPINAETAIALENKERLELLKGSSGIQAGSSAPGGLVNLVVKRPVAKRRSATLGWQQSGTFGASLDIGDRSDAFGWRINAALQRLDPIPRNTQGSRHLLALAADWQPGPDTLLEAEIESSHQSQPSVAGFSMLGSSVPAANRVDPRINLNRQPWNVPVVFDGTTASLRWQQRLGEDWRLRAQAMTQRLRTDDRTAFPYGLYDSDYICAQWCDRFAPDGSFTYWQYISDNERRNSDVLEIAAHGSLTVSGVHHAVEVGLLQTRYSGRFRDQVFDIAGSGSINGSLNTPASPMTPGPNTNRNERSTEIYLRDAMQFSSGSSVWAGLRHTGLYRESELTRPVSGDLQHTDYNQSASIPWLALSQQLTPQTMLYASWGKGLESDVAPNRARYVNAGRPLAGLQSRQIEAGLKHAGEAFEVSVAAFDIDRPQTADIGPCDVDASCSYQIDGSARHRGLEGQFAWRAGAWNAHLGAMWLHAERRGASQASVNGTRPVNVPRITLRSGLGYRVAATPGLELQSSFVAEGDRTLLPYDPSVRIPGWARIDLAARWVQRFDATTFTWRAGLDNVTDRRAWKESPYQFGHVYLYPLSPRTWRASLQAAF